MQKQTYATVVRAKGDDAEILISTVGQDRDGDVLDPEGLVKEPYAANPVVLFGHRHDQLPVGATTALDVESGRGIRARFRWLKGDEFADRVRNAFDQGVLRAASVGFIPREFAPLPGGRGLHISKWELIEWSLVCVPANPEAVRTLKSLGLWSAAEDVVLELAETSDEGVLEIAPEDDDITAVRRHLAAQIRTATLAAMRARGVDGGDPLGDPAAKAHVQGLMRSAIRDSVGEIIREAAASAVARVRGRVE